MSLRPLLIAVVLLSLQPIAHATSVDLDFGAPIPGTLPDANGLGTGFTSRLPMTGTIYANDPHLSLTQDPGQLTITPALADTLGPQNLNQMETFGVQAYNRYAFSTSAEFDNIGVQSSQLQLFAGINGNNFIRAGFHADTGGDTSVFIYGIWYGSQTPYFLDQPTGIMNGDNATLTLTQDGNLWSLAWQSLTHPDVGGSSPLEDVKICNLNNFPMLYTGIYYNAPPRPAPTPEATGLVSFSMHDTPEPSTFVLCAFAMVLLGLLRGKRAHR